jgi:hypothetical protein
MTDQQISDTATLDLDHPVAGDEVAGDVIAEAVDVIDRALAQMMQRELVSSGEMADLLLDLRMLLTTER